MLICCDKNEHSNFFRGPMGWARKVIFLSSMFTEETGDSFWTALRRPHEKRVVNAGRSPKSQGIEFQPKNFLTVFWDYNIDGSLLLSMSNKFHKLLNRHDSFLELRLCCSGIWQILTYVRLGRHDEAVQLLKSVVQRDVPDREKKGNEVFAEVVSICRFFL